jgi:hypothetical protein
MSIEQLINGYLVVRKPSCGFDAKGRAGFRKTAARIGELFYGGMMRLPWFDLDEANYNGTLPSELRDLLKQIVGGRFKTGQLWSNQNQPLLLFKSKEGVLASSD